jgi:hypothetical protein
VAIVRRLGRWWPGLADLGGLSALAVWLGTPLLFYMYIAPPMSHATSAFAVAVFILAWLIVRDTWSVGGMAVLGALAAVMAMVREQDAFFIAGPRSTSPGRCSAPAAGPIAPARRRSRGRRNLRADVHAAGACLPRAQRPHRPVTPGGTEDVLVFAPRAPGRRLAVARLPHLDAIGGHRVRGAARSAAPSAG